MAKTKISLNKEQIDYITKKVNELGSYKLVCRFYDKDDMVSSFAKNLSEELFEDEFEDEPTTKTKKKATKKKENKKKATTVKRKRKINIKEVLDE